MRSHSSRSLVACVSANFSASCVALALLCIAAPSGGFAATVSVKTFGAKGDGLVYDDGACSGAGFSSTTATFTPADIGKTIQILGAAIAAAPLTTTVASVAGAHNVTLSAACTTAVTGAAFVYGTDDTASIQSAVNSVGTGPGAIDFPASIYVLTGQIIAPAGSAPLYVGDGQTKTEIYQTNLSAGLFKWNNSAAVAASGGVPGGGVVDMSLFGSIDSYGDPGQGPAIWGLGVGNGFLVQNVSEQGFGTAEALTGAWNTYTANTTFLRNRYYAVAIGTDPTYPITAGNTFVGFNWSNQGAGWASRGDHGLEIQQSGGEFLSTGDITAFVTGVAVEPGAPSGGHSPQALYLVMNQVISDSNTGVGWLIYGVNGPVWSFTCGNCWAGYNGSQGLLIQGSKVDSLRWEAGRIRENVNQGALVSLGAQHVSFQDSEITGNGRTTSAGTYAGLEFAAGVTGFHATGNTFGNFATSGSPQGNSVKVDVGASDYYVIDSNITYATGGGAAAISDGGTGTHKVVTNNVGP